eukprot:10628172-Alexandrium_andersonii.AAC.1
MAARPWRWPVALRDENHGPTRTARRPPPPCTARRPNAPNTSARGRHAYTEEADPEPAAEE